MKIEGNGYTYVYRQLSGSFRAAGRTSHRILVLRPTGSSGRESKRVLFKSMAQVRNGKTISLNAETIGCGGGKFYTGFTDMPEHVPGFVSLKEKYKKTPDMVVDFIQELQVPKAEKPTCTLHESTRLVLSTKWKAYCFLPRRTCWQDLPHGLFSTAMQRMPYQLLSVRAVVP